MKRRTPNLDLFDKSYHQRYNRLAGVDEAGRGPLAGPVVAAAVVLPHPCRLSGLNDSKQLTPVQRKVLYALIQGVALDVGIGMVEPCDIDRLNIRQATFCAMREAIRRLATPPSYVLVDGSRIPELGIPQMGIVHGDARSASIAAASIVAKVTRDALMEAMDDRFPGYGFRRHKGYGTEAHLEALKRLGPTPLHRRSFAPVRACLTDRQDVAPASPPPERLELPLVSSN